MPFQLIELPFDSGALAPAISAETLSFHHGKHHKAYVDKTNAAIEGTDLASKSLEDVIVAARGSNKVPLMPCLPWKRCGPALRTISSNRYRLTG